MIFTFEDSTPALAPKEYAKALDILQERKANVENNIPIANIVHTGNPE